MSAETAPHARPDGIAARRPVRCGAPRTSTWSPGDFRPPPSKLGARAGMPCGPRWPRSRGWARGSHRPATIAGRNRPLRSPLIASQRPRPGSSAPRSNPSLPRPLAKENCISQFSADPAGRCRALPLPRPAPVPRPYSSKKYLFSVLHSTGANRRYPLVRRNFGRTPPLYVAGRGWWHVPSHGDRRAACPRSTRWRSA